VAQLTRDEVIPGGIQGSDDTAIGGGFSYTSIAVDGSSDIVRVDRSPLADRIRIGRASERTRLAHSDILYYLGGNADALSYLGQPSSGNIDVRVKVHVQGETLVPEEGVLMIRQSQSPGSQFVSIGKDESGNVIVRWRSSPSGVVDKLSTSSLGELVWLRLIKDGSSIEALYSEDALYWRSIVKVDTTFTGTVYYLGLVDLAGGSQSVPRVAFSNFDVTR
jgi:hypothetical protein